MAKKLYWDKKEDIKKIIYALNQDQVLISSTDTIYGFLANTTQKAWQKILDLKEVKTPRPFLILISAYNTLDKLSYFTDISQFDKKTLKFIDVCWPGPITFICNAKKELSHFLSATVVSDTFLGEISEKRTIALRCPMHVGLQEILSHFKGLFSTSANKSMERSPAKFDQISPDLLNQINYVVMDKQESSVIQASTLINLSEPDYTKPFPFQVIRPGEYSLEDLQELYHKI